MDFLTLSNRDKIAYQYTANGFVPEVKKAPLKKMTDGRTVRRLEDIIDQNILTQKPLVIVVHDFPNTNAFLGPNNLTDTYIKRLQKEGFPTLHFHFRGCGQSDGRQQDLCFDTAIEDFKSMMEWARMTHRHDRFAIIAAGLSASVIAQAYDKHTMSSLTLLWPIFDPMNTPFRVIDTLENRKFMAEHDYVQCDESQIGLLLANEIRKLDVLPLLSNIKTLTQIQQGTADMYSPYENMSGVRTNLTGLKDFAVFEDGEHALPDPQMRKQVVDNTLYFLNKYAYRKPPGDAQTINKATVFRDQGR